MKLFKEILHGHIIKYVVIRLLFWDISSQLLDQCQGVLWAAHLGSSLVIATSYSSLVIIATSSSSLVIANRHNYRASSAGVIYSNYMVRNFIYFC